MTTLHNNNNNIYAILASLDEKIEISRCAAQMDKMILGTTNDIK